MKNINRDTGTNKEIRKIAAAMIRKSGNSSVARFDVQDKGKRSALKKWYLEMDAIHNGLQRYRMLEILHSTRQVFHFRHHLAVNSIAPLKRMVAPEHSPGRRAEESSRRA